MNLPESNISELFFKDEVYAIAGAMMEVYKAFGTGFLEPVYQEALAVEFSLRGIPYERERPLELYYKNVRLEKKYVPDFVCFGTDSIRAQGTTKADQYRSCSINKLS